jgi:hypothetical protein
VGDQPPLQPEADTPAFTPLTPAGLHAQIAQAAQIVSNLDHKVLLIHADTVRLRLIRFNEDVKAQVYWGAPAGLVLGFVANLLQLNSTTTFTPLFGMNQDQWQGLNIGGLLVSGGAAALLGFRAWKKSRKAGNTVDAVMDDLLTQSKAATHNG